MKRLVTIFLLLSIIGLWNGRTASAQSTYSWTTTSVSGTDLSGTDIRYWAPGMNTGWFDFYYNFYTVPDSVIINFGGFQVYSSGGYVAGITDVSLMFGPAPPGTTPLLEVIMNAQGPLPGTAWDYTLTPTQKPVLQSLSISGPASLGENAPGIYQATATYSSGSSKLVAATWSSSSAALKLAPTASHLEATASPVAKATTVKISATYTEDGVTVNASGNVLLGDEAIT